MKPHAAPTLSIAPEALPEALRELVRVLGDAGALRLTGVVGGQRITVPKRALPDHPLRAGLGNATFEALVAEYAGISMDVPKCDGFLRVLRHEQVRQCRAQGLTIDETAEATGYTRRHVINIMGGDEAGDVYTIDMFAAPAPAAPKSYAGSANDPFGLGGRRA
jgi:hypothetical protein